MTIGIFGYNEFADALYGFLDKRPMLNARIERICVNRFDRSILLPFDMFTNDPDELLYSKDINVFIELLNNPEASFNIVRTGLQSGKTVIATNAAMADRYRPELSLLKSKYANKLICELSASEIVNQAQRKDEQLYAIVTHQIISESKNKLYFFN
jgi:homoserine dehydrogenase